MPLNTRDQSTDSFADWCVVNVANGEWYAAGQARMVASLRAHGYRGETLLWRDALPPGCPTHEITPYAFKVWAIQHARAQGFQRVAWLDSSIVAVNSLTPIANWLRTQPVFIHAQPATMVGNWASDDSIQWLRIEREQAMLIHSLDASVLFFDFTRPSASRVFERWHAAALAGTPFRGSHRNDLGQVSADPRVLGHRHDQTILSIIAWQEGLPAYQWFDSITRHAKRYRLREDTVFVCRRKCYGFETHGAVGTPLWRLLYHPRNALRRLLGRD